jgi:ABC-type transport system involved in multi-copper enzyme maturation permease subunit
VRLVSSELLKLWTTRRTVAGLVLALTAIVALGSIGTLASTDGPPTQQTVRDVLSVTGFTDVFALILGVLVVTWEYRHDTITQTFLLEPRRERVIGAKSIAAMLTGVLLAVAALVFVIVLAYIWIGGDPGISFGGSVWERAARGIASAALYGALGVGIGALIRSQALAIVVVFVFFLVVEPLVNGLYDTVGRYLPGSALTQLAGESSDQTSLSTAAAVPVSIAWVVGIVAVAAVLTVRRDVT